MSIASETISLSKSVSRNPRWERLSLEISPKNKTTQSHRVVLLFTLQSLHPRQGWECSNCSEVLTWLFYFLYPLEKAASQLPCPSLLVAWADASWERDAFYATSHLLLTTATLMQALLIVAWYVHGSPLCQICSAEEKVLLLCCHILPCFSLLKHTFKEAFSNL